jgi:nucleotide-binding universal stress UspA family protein
MNMVDGSETWRTIGVAGHWSRALGLKSSWNPRLRPLGSEFGETRSVEMRIVVGFLRSPEGRAALARAVSEARLRDAELLVVHSARGGERDEASEIRAYRDEFAQVQKDLDASGVTYRIVDYARGNSPAQDLLAAAGEHDAGLLVVGIRRRSPVGKLVLGSNAQEILLQADCPVLAVKAPSD